MDDVAPASVNTQGMASLGVVKPRKALFTVYSDAENGAPPATATTSKRTSSSSVKSLGKRRPGGLSMDGGKKSWQEGDKVVRPKKSLVLAKIQSDTIDEEGPVSSPLAPKDNKAVRPGIYRTRSSASSVKTITAATPTAASFIAAGTRPVLQQKAKPPPSTLEELFDGKTPFAPASPGVEANAVQPSKASTSRSAPAQPLRSVASQRESRGKAKKSLFSASIYVADPVEQTFDLDHENSSAPPLIPLNLGANPGSDTIAEPLPFDAICPQAPRLAFVERFETTYEDSADQIATPTLRGSARRSSHNASEENTDPNAPLNSKTGTKVGSASRRKAFGDKGGWNGQVSPLAEVTEAFTGQQGAWGVSFPSPTLPREDAEAPSVRPVPAFLHGHLADDSDAALVRLEASASHYALSRAYDHFFDRQRVDPFPVLRLGVLDPHLPPPRRRGCQPQQGHRSRSRIAEPSRRRASPFGIFFFVFVVVVVALVGPDGQDNGQGPGH